MLSKRVKAISCVGSLLFGTAILGISLLAASQPFAYEAPAKGQTTLYLNSRMLPDHVLYPASMVLDKTVLLTSSQEKKSTKQVAFAFDRLESVAQLLEKEQPQLALVTLKKSQHYLLLANDAARADENCSAATKQYLRRALRAHIKRTTQLLSSFPAEDQQQVRDILTQSISLYQNLPSETL
jgi:hypothetical protein